MTKLCIKKFKEGNENPSTTVSIPLMVIKMVKSLILSVAQIWKVIITNLKKLSLLILKERQDILILTVKILL